MLGVVDFAFDKSNNTVQEIIISGSLMEDLWLGRKSMPVLVCGVFTRTNTYRQGYQEEITALQKVLKLVNMDSI